MRLRSSNHSRNSWAPSLAPRPTNSSGFFTSLVMVSPSAKLLMDDPSPLRSLEEEDVLSEGLKLSLHLIEAGHLLLELAEEVWYAGLVQGLGIGDLLIQPGLTHLRRGDDGCLGFGLSDPQ